MGSFDVGRLIDSFYVTDTDWSNEVTTGPDGWKWCLDLLRMSQTYFPGQSGESIQAMAMAPGIAWLATGGSSEDLSHAMVHITCLAPTRAPGAGRRERRWQAWLERALPAPAPTD